MVKRSELAYIVKELKERDMYSRTLVHLVLWFLCDEEDKDELFTPMKECMYAPRVQVVLQFLEKHNEKVKEWSEELVDSEFKEKVRKLIESGYVKDIKRLCLFSRVDFLVRRFGDGDFGMLRTKAWLLGWKDIANMGDREIDDVIKELKDFVMYLRGNG